MKAVLAPNEKVRVDSGYPVEKCLIPILVQERDREMFDRIRARHEIVNGRLKQFAAICHRFFHHISLHSYCFHDAANVMQLLMEVEDPLFDI